jgi:hypothetical protein
LVSDPLTARRVGITNVLRSIRLWGLVVVFAACGPPLTEPSAVDLTGRWTSVDHVGPVFNFEMIIHQSSDGTIVGTYSSDVSPPHPPCPPDISDKAVGTVDGNNAIIGVQLSLKGVGDFQGQVVSDSTLRGSFQSCGNDYAVTFSLAGPAPAG